MLRKAEVDAADAYLALHPVVFQVVGNNASRMKYQFWSERAGPLTGGQKPFSIDMAFK